MYKIKRFESLNENRILNRILPYIFFLYSPNVEVKNVPNVLNNSKYSIKLKSEDSNEIIILSPGESYDGRIDGISHPIFGVYKVVDYVDEIFGIQIYDDKLKLGDLPLEVNNKLGGGHLDKSPDIKWDGLFENMRY